MKKYCTFLKLTGTLYLIFFLSGCPQVSKKTKVLPSTPPQASQLLQNYHKNNPPLQTLKGYAEVEVQARGKTDFFEAAFLLEYPNRLRIEILDDLGQQQGLMIANGTQVIWREIGKEDIQYAEQNSEALKKVFKLPLSVEEFIARLLLRVPNDPVVLQTSVISDDPQSIEFKHPEFSFTISNPDLILKKFSKKKKGRSSTKVFEVQYHYIQDPGTLQNYPQDMDLIFFRPQAKISIHFLDAKLNTLLNPEVFNLD